MTPKKSLITTCLIVITIVLMFGFNNNLKAQNAQFFMLEQGKIVPDFAFKTLNGDKHNLYNFKNRPVVIHFWASWCPPCIVEFPDLIKTANKHKNIVILAFSSDKNERSVHKFIKKYNLEIPANLLIIHDKNQHVTKELFSVFRLPESFILKNNFILDDHIIGTYDHWDKLK